LDKVFDSVLKSLKSFRFWSLTLGATSIVPVIYFMYQNWMFSQWASAQTSSGGPVCGTGIFALLLICTVVGGVFAAAGSLLGMIGYLRTEKPRPKKRLFEIALVGSGMVIALITGFALI